MTGVQEQDLLGGRTAMCDMQKGWFIEREILGRGTQCWQGCRGTAAGLQPCRQGHSGVRVTVEAISRTSPLPIWG